MVRPPAEEQTHRPLGVATSREAVLAYQDRGDLTKILTNSRILASLPQASPTGTATNFAPLLNRHGEEVRALPQLVRVVLDKTHIMIVACGRRGSSSTGGTTPIFGVAPLAGSAPSPTNRWGGVVDQHHLE